jgi:exosortase
MSNKTSPPASFSVRPARVAVATLLGATCLWAYWPTFETLADKWFHDPQYSHGYLVPVFAVALLWLRWKRLPAATWGFHAWGLPLLALGAALRAVAAYVYFDWLDAASLLPTLAGLFVLLGGWPALAWAWPALAFLLFMVPLPYQIETALSHPLQQLATYCSTYVLQTLGFAAVSEGNVILLGADKKIGVFEACSGLSMLMTFFALAVGLLMLVRRPWTDTLVVVASAIPIALVANVVRITVTGIALEYFGQEAAHRIFHDWAGLLMMPLALLLLAAELWLIDHLLVPVREKRVSPLDRAGPPPVAPRPKKRRGRNAVPSPLKKDPPSPRGENNPPEGRKQGPLPPFPANEAR